MPIHADNAARSMFIAQIAALAAGVAAVGMFLADPFPRADDIVEARTASDTSRTSPERQAQEDRDAPTFEHTDWRVLLPSISWAAPDPQPARTEDEIDAADLAQQLAGVESEAPPEEPATQRPNVDWRYIGYLRQTDDAMALLAIDARQRFVSVGDQIQDHRIVSIEPKAIIINDGRNDMRIEMAGRTEPSVARPTTLTPPNWRGTGNDTEDLDKIRERIEREREQELERRRQNPLRPEEWIPS